jgi:uncharacterized protein YjiS (DUF1127 family)
MEMIRLEGSSDLMFHREPIAAENETPKGKTMFASLHTATLATRSVQSRGMFHRLFAALDRAVALHNERRALAAMDDARLFDLGLTRAEACAEAQRPVWDRAPRRR